MREVRAARHPPSPAPPVFYVGGAVFFCLILAKIHHEVVMEYSPGWSAAEPREGELLISPILQGWRNVPPPLQGGFYFYAVSPGLTPWAIFHHRFAVGYRVLSRVPFLQVIISTKDRLPTIWITGLCALFSKSSGRD